jgi:hypothetical protein
MTSDPDRVAEAQAQREIERLHHDTALVLHLLDGLGQAHPLETPTPREATYYHVTTDLWFKLVEHNRAVAALASDLFSSAVVVHRAAYEILVNLGYLIRQGDKHRNALLFMARSLLEVAEQFASEPSGTAAAAVLPRMPQDVVDEARGCQAKHRPWSGQTLRKMATDIGVEGHDWFYAVSSWEAHGRVAGYRVTESTLEGAVDLRRLTFSSRAPAAHREALANHARRNLHKAYQLVAWDWFGTVPGLATTDPFAANDEARGAGSE